MLVVGRGSGIARAVTLLARSEGARVVVAGRDKAKLVDAYQDIADPEISAEVVDITHDASIVALADRLGPIDHVVSTASARARGKLTDLQRENLQLSFDTKVIGPTTSSHLGRRAHSARRRNTGPGWPHHQLPTSTSGPIDRS